MHASLPRHPNLKQTALLCALALAVAFVHFNSALAQPELPPVSKNQLEKALNRSDADHEVVLETVDGASSFILQAAGRIEPVEGRLLGFEVSRPEGLSVEEDIVSGQLATGAVGFRVFGPIRELILSQPSSIRVHVDVPKPALAQQTDRSEAAPLRRTAEMAVQPGERVAVVLQPPKTEDEAEPETEEDAGKGWRFVPDGKIEVTDLVGAGDIDRRRRVEYSDFPLQGLSVEEIGDRPCFLRLHATGEHGDITQPYIGCGTTFRHLGEDGPAQRRDSRRSALLPAGHAVVALEVCLNNTGKNARIKGIEVRGWRPAEYLDEDLDLDELMASDSFSRPNCRQRGWVSCPRRSIATGVVATIRLRGEKRNWVNGLKLICRPIERI